MLNSRSHRAVVIDVDEFSTDDEHSLPDLDLAELVIRPSSSKLCDCLLSNTYTHRTGSVEHYTTSSDGTSDVRWYSVCSH